MTQTEDMKEVISDIGRSNGGSAATDDIRRQGRHMLESAEHMPTNVYLGAVAGSIILSAFLFLSGKKNLGQFVGLWAPTILNLAIFTKQLKPSREIR